MKVALVKNLPANARDARDSALIPGLGRSTGERNGNSLQYSCWKIPQTEESGRLQFTGSQRVGHALATTHSKCRTTQNHSSIELIRKCFQNDCDVILMLFTH